MNSGVRKLRFALLLGLSLTAFGQQGTVTYTPNLGLAVLPHGYQAWDTLVNQNTNILDASILPKAGGTMTGPLIIAEGSVQNSLQLNATSGNAAIGLANLSAAAGLKNWGMSQDGNGIVHFTFLSDDSTASNDFMTCSRGGASGFISTGCQFPGGLRDSSGSTGTASQVPVASGGGAWLWGTTMTYPAAGLALSTGTAWGASINPTSLATWPAAGIPVSTGTAWGTSIVPSSLATWPAAGLAYSTGSAWGTAIPNNLGVRWSSDTTATGTVDLRISRQGPGVLQVGTGTSTNSVFVYGSTTPQLSTPALLITTPPYNISTADPCYPSCANGPTWSPVIYLNNGNSQTVPLAALPTQIAVNASESGLFMDFFLNGTAVMNFTTSGAIATNGYMAALTGFQTGSSILLAQAGLVGLPNTGVAWSGQTSGSVAWANADTVIGRYAAGVLQIANGSGPTWGNGALRLGMLKGSMGTSGTTTTVSIAAGPGAGTAPTVTVTGAALAGKITMTTGTAPAASAIVATVSFDFTTQGIAIPPFVNAPFVTLTPGNAATAALGSAEVFTTSTTTNWSINSGATALTASTQYIWNYHVIGAG